MDNGILPHIPGDYIGAGANSLPKAEAGRPSPQEVTIDVPDHGKVRIRYELKKYRHGRSTYWSWLAVWAGKDPG